MVDITGFLLSVATPIGVPNVNFCPVLNSVLFIVFF